MKPTKTTNQNLKKAVRVILAVLPIQVRINANIPQSRVARPLILIFLAPEAQFLPRSEKKKSEIGDQRSAAPSCMRI